MFISNQKILLENNKIICKQNFSAPGVRKLFKLKPNTNYELDIDCELKDDGTTLRLWICDEKRNTILGNNDCLITQEKQKFKYIYHNKNLTDIYIGFIFKCPKIGNEFIINKLEVKDISPKPQNNIQPIIKKVTPPVVKKIVPPPVIKKKVEIPKTKKKLKKKNLKKK